MATIVTSEQAKPVKDVAQIINYLSRQFNHLTADYERAQRSKEGVANSLYRMQTEFAYLLNEIAQGPQCMLQKYITMSNDYLDDLAVQSRNRKNLLRTTK